MTTGRAPSPVVGIVPHLGRPHAVTLALATIEALESRGATVRVPTTDAVRTGLDAWAHDDATFAEGLTLAFSLGGDGTMLRTVDLVAAQDVPVLGVNVGHLGYLAAIQPEELPAALERLLAGDHDIEERMTLSVEVAERQADGTLRTLRRHLALNDAVLEKSSAGSTVRLGVSFNDEAFTDYSADGLIIATPTGSTAYAFSVRGPIVSPLMHALVVVPISPHMLFDRSLVLDGSETVQVELLDGRSATLFVDGRDAGELDPRAVVVCRAGAHPARLVTLGRRAFHGILKAKFGLPGPGTPGRIRFGDREDGAEGVEVGAPEGGR